MGGAAHRSELAGPGMLFKLTSHQSHCASLAIVLASSFNVLDHQGGEEGDVGEHPGPAARAGGVVAPVAGGAQEVPPGAAVDGAGGRHLQADWTPHPLLQLLHQLVHGLALLLQHQLLFQESFILSLPVSLVILAILTKSARFVVVVVHGLG